MLSFEHLGLLRAIIIAPETLTGARLRKGAFTRKRSMPFADALRFMLSMCTTTIQTRLNAFFRRTKWGEPISQQAFSQLRANFDHSPFEKMVRVPVIKEYSGSYDLPLWNGYHILGIDGSYLQLPREERLRKEFGIRGEGTCPSAGISVLFDVLHGWALDPILTHTNMNERAECVKHIDFLCEHLPHIAKSSILLLDRGYPSEELFGKLQSSGLKYLARCKARFTVQVNDAPIGDSCITLKNGTIVRIVKFILPNDDIEILATNMRDIPQEQLQDLYALRWGVEVLYFRLKQELCVEKFSGKTPNSVRQDFWASMAILNCVATFKHEADTQISKRHASIPTKNTYQARTSDLIITLRDRFIFASLCGDPEISALEIKEVIETMARSVSPIRPGRSFPRNPKPYLAVNHHLKSHL